MMVQTLLLVAVAIIACILCNKITSKVGIPMLLAFLAVGILCGTNGILKIDFNNYNLTENICTAALIFIIFYGGFGTKWSAAKPVALKASLLSTIGVFLTALAVGIFCHFILSISWLESLLIGSVLGSTDAASVFSILRSKSLNLKYGTASLLEVESGSNDPIAYLMTTIILTMLTSEISTGQVIYQIFAQIVYGLGIGIIIAVAVVHFLKRFQFDTSGFDMVFMIAVSILSYVLPTIVGGNGYLSAYIAGIIIGNSDIPNKKNQVHFFDGITSLMQLIVFFILGLLCTPYKIPSVIIPALLIAIFLTFIARPIVVSVLLTPFKTKFVQQILISWAGLRGATSAVFAITAIASTAVLKYDVFHIVFCIVLFSIALQGTLLPTVAKKLNMIDMNENVMKTFNDYMEEDIMQLMHLKIHEGHPWIGTQIHNLTLPPDVRIAVILRGNDSVIPKGDTTIEENDVTVLSTMPCTHVKNIQLYELNINEKHKWNKKQIQNLSLTKNTSIIMIRRNSETIIPQGNTIILDGDTLVMCGK